MKIIAVAVVIREFEVCVSRAELDGFSREGVRGWVSRKPKNQ